MSILSNLPLNFHSNLVFRNQNNGFCAYRILKFKKHLYLLICCYFENFPNSRLPLKQIDIDSIFDLWLFICYQFQDHSSTVFFTYKLLIVSLNCFLSNMLKNYNPKFCQFDYLRVKKLFFLPYIELFLINI